MFVALSIHHQSYSGIKLFFACTPVLYILSDHDSNSLALDHIHHYNSNDEIVYIRPKFIESEIFTYDSLINLLEPVTETGRSDPILQPPSSGILKSQDLFNSLSASYKVQNGRLIKL